MTKENSNSNKQQNNDNGKQQINKQERVIRWPEPPKNVSESDKKGEKQLLNNLFKGNS